MDHAEVRAWIEEEALRPGGLAEPADPRVADHLASCADCSAERDAMQAVEVALGVAIGPPRGARERTLAAVAQVGRDRRAVHAPVRRPPRFAGWRLPRLSLPALAAALGFAAVVFLAGALVGSTALREPVEPSRLPAVASVLGQLVLDPASQTLALRDGAGADAGVVVHNAPRDQVVVLTAALSEPEAGRYSCYLERESERVPIGPMHFEEETAFWAGPMSGPEDAGRPGDRFLVVLDDSDGVPVLVGEF
jgi:hypothetical protein